MDKSAISVIHKYWDKDPVDIVSIIRDIDVEYENFPMTDELKGLSGYIQNIGGDRYVIAVNALDHIFRQRFTAAHELGHYIYHRDRIGDGVDDNRAYRSTTGGKFFNTSIGPVQEKQANQFAANVLMPRHLIDTLKNKGFRSPDDLARRLHVSRPAMRIHLGLPLEYTAKSQTEDTAEP